MMMWHQFWFRSRAALRSHEHRYCVLSAATSGSVLGGGASCCNQYHTVGRIAYCEEETTEPPSSTNKEAQHSTTSTPNTTEKPIHRFPFSRRLTSFDGFGSRQPSSSLNGSSRVRHEEKRGIHTETGDDDENVSETGKRAKRTVDSSRYNTNNSQEEDEPPIRKRNYTKKVTLQRMMTQKARELDTTEPSLWHDSTISSLLRRRLMERKKKKKTEPPLIPLYKVGCYSCHGIEPHKSEVIVNRPIELFSGLDQAIIATTCRKINQDRGHVTFPYAGDAKSALFATYDGHGDRGEMVAEFAMNSIRDRLYRHPEYESNLLKAVRDTFVGLDTDILHRKDMEPMHSGSTACIVLLQDRHLYAINVGDSRAVLGTRHAVGLDRSDEIKAVDLTTDQSASCPLERQRILNSGGYVTEPAVPGYPWRVWLDPECTRVGLAMSRSLGDHAVKNVGILPDPVITEWTLTPQDEFIIVATDGIWEFIESSEAVALVQDYFENGYGANEACQALIHLAMLRWSENEESYRDDITAIVVKVNELWNDDESETTPIEINASSPPPSTP